MTTLPTIEKDTAIPDSEMENLFELFGVLHEIDKANQMRERSV